LDLLPRWLRREREKKRRRRTTTTKKKKKKAKTRFTQPGQLDPNLPPPSRFFFF